MKWRFIAGTCILLAGLGMAAMFAQPPVLRVIGQPEATGFVQARIEAPAFDRLAAEAKGHFGIEYKAASSQLAPDEMMLSALKTDRVDVLSMRFSALSSVEPSLAGLVLPGALGSFEDARRFAKAYGPYIDKRLQENWGSKLLGLWTFGPQVVICTKPLPGLRDLATLRVRVASDAQGALVSRLKAKPLKLPFERVKEAFSAGSIDCAISSVRSAADAGWFTSANSFLTLPIDFGINGYAISTKAWAKLDRSGQASLMAAIDRLVDDIWRQAEQQHNLALKCTTYAERCNRQSIKLTGVFTVTKASNEDWDYLHSVALKDAASRWSASVASGCADCLDNWLKAAHSAGLQQPIDSAVD